jgi:hypothetical protein
MGPRPCSSDASSSGPLGRLGVHREEPFATITGVESELDESAVMPDEVGAATGDPPASEFPHDMRGDLNAACLHTREAPTAQRRIRDGRSRRSTS